MRLIDADALQWSFKANGSKFYGESRIKNAPTVDAIEVVRCENCAFAFDYDPTNDNAPLTGKLWCDYWLGGVKKDGYCFKGERREEG